MTSSESGLTVFPTQSRGECIVCIVHKHLLLTDSVTYTLLERGKGFCQPETSYESQGCPPGTPGAQ